jgi:hypothetical protein
MRHLSLAVTAIALLPSATSAASEDDRTRARVLFNEGLDLRHDGKHADALRKFRSADSLVSTPRTRLELGRQLTLVGRYVEALSVLQSVASMVVDSKDAAKYAPAKQEAAVLASEVEKKTPRITIVCGVGAVVRIDDVAITSPQNPVLVDPGDHVVDCGGDHHEHRSVHVELGARVDLDLRPASPATESSPPRSPRSPDPAMSERRIPTLSLGLFAAGAVTAVAGTTFGLLAWSTNNRSEQHCSFGCSDDGANLRRRAGTQADISTALVTVSILCVGVGAIIWVAQPTRFAPTVSLHVGPTWLGIGARF